MRYFLLVLLTVVASGCQSSAPDASVLLRPYGALGDRMDVLHLPRQRVLQRRVRGSYAQHPTVIRAIGEVASRHGLADEDARYIGIYPDDPRTTPEGELSWIIALPIGPIQTSVEAPYEITTWPSCRAVVYETTSSDLPDRSHRADEVIRDHRLRQAAPTRMVMLGKNEAGEDIFRVVKPVAPSPDRE